MVSDAEEATKMKPNGGCKLRAMVRSDDRRNTKSGDPGINKGGSTVSCSGGREGYSFWPARGAVNDCDEIGITGRRREDQPDQYEGGKISGHGLGYVGEEFWYGGEL